MREQGFAMFQKLVEYLIKLVFATPLQAIREQVLQGALVIPLPTRSLRPDPSEVKGDQRI